MIGQGSGPLNGQVSTQTTSEGWRPKDSTVALWIPPCVLFLRLFSSVILRCREIWTRPSLGSLSTQVKPPPRLLQYLMPLHRPIKIRTSLSCTPHTLSQYSVQELVIHPADPSPLLSLPLFPFPIKPHDLRVLPPYIQTPACRCVMNLSFQTLDPPLHIWHPWERRVTSVVDRSLNSQLIDCALKQNLIGYGVWCIFCDHLAIFGRIDDAFSLVSDSQETVPRLEFSVN